MDSIKQNLENAKNKGKDYYNQMTGQQSMSISYPFLSLLFLFQFDPEEGIWSCWIGV